MNLTKNNGCSLVILGGILCLCVPAVGIPLVVIGFVLSTVGSDEE